MFFVVVALLKFVLGKKMLGVSEFEGISLSYCLFVWVGGVADFFGLMCFCFDGVCLWDANEFSGF